MFFVRNFNMTLEESGTLKDYVEIQHLRTLVHGEALCQFTALSSEVKISRPENLSYIILGLGTDRVKASLRNKSSEWLD